MCQEEGEAAFNNSARSYRIKITTHKREEGLDGQINNNKNKFILFQEDVLQGTIMVLLNYLIYT